VRGSGSARRQTRQRPHGHPQLHKDQEVARLRKKPLAHRQRPCVHQERGPQENERRHEEPQSAPTALLDRVPAFRGEDVLAGADLHG